MALVKPPPTFPSVFNVPHPLVESFLPTDSACILPACSSSAAAALLCCWKQAPAPVTVLVSDSARSLETIYQDYHTLSGEEMDSTAYFPGWENLTDADLQGVSPEIAGDRLQTLTRLHGSKEPLIIFTDIQSLMQAVPDPGSLKSRTLNVKTGFRKDLESFCEDLLGMGYEFEAEVTDKGEAAKRGGVLDIWPPNQPSPFRLEFFGDEVDSIRTFDSATQRSLEKAHEVHLLPAKESLSGETACFTDYLPASTRWLFFDYNAIADHAVLYQESREEVHQSWPELQHQITLHSKAGILRTGDGLPGDPLPLQIEACAGLADLPRQGDVSLYLEEERTKIIQEQCHLAKSGWTVVFCMNTEGSRARFLEAYDSLIRDCKNLYLVNGMIAEGFRYPDLQLSVVGERDIYGLRKPVRNKYDPHAGTRGGKAQMGTPPVRMDGNRTGRMGCPPRSWNRKIFGTL